MEKNIVYLIGAGPGNPGLATIKALELIKKADCIIYDRLANKRLIEYTKEDAEVIYVGKKGRSHIMSQDEINDLIVKKAREGKVVARLKGGDPFVFGRGSEEALALAEEGIPFEVVSGVTSPIAAPAYAGIPLTHKDYSSTVVFITGHEDPEKKGTSIAWDKISTGAGTLVFLMGTKNLSHNVKKLTENGRAPDTPVAIIRWGTRPEQKTVTGTLKDIVAKAGGIKPPTVMVVGEVVRLREKLNWFETKPLFGKRILITRTKEQAGEFSEMLRSHGAEPIECPTIQIDPPDSWERFDKALDNIEQYNWIIFTSVNGVRFFIKRLRAIGKDIRILKDIKICTIGPRTAKGVEDLGINVDLLPKRYVAEAIIDELGKDEIKDKRFLLPRAMKAREVLPEEIKKYGGKIDVVTVYKTIRPKSRIDETRELLKRQTIDLVTFTSSSTVTNFVEGFKKGEAQELLSGIDVACIGPITAGTAKGLGIDTTLMPDKYTIPGLVETMVRFFQSKNLS